MRIGFIGLGIMGKPMALNLVKAGFDLTVFNRTPSKCSPLIEVGATQAHSPREVAIHSEVIITVVSDTPDVAMVLFGPDGISQGVRDGGIVIDMSTISPEATIEFSRRLAQRNCEMLDAPVSGGEKGALEGTLAIMVGGKRETFERCLPILQAMGKTIVFTGVNGNGQKTKLVNQTVCALNIAAMVEGLRLARSTGLDVQTTLQVISSGAAGSWMLSNLAPRILRNDFAPGFSIKLQQKDLRLVREAVQALGSPFPGVELAYSLFTDAIAAGLENQGTQGLINLFERQTTSIPPDDSRRQ
jgi:3-hydroxyisobutyrate dehydrogenase